MGFGLDYGDALQGTRDQGAEPPSHGSRHLDEDILGPAGWPERRAFPLFLRPPGILLNRLVLY